MSQTVYWSIFIVLTFSTDSYAQFGQNSIFNQILSPSIASNTIENTPLKNIPQQFQDFICLFTSGCGTTTRASTTTSKITTLPTTTTRSTIITTTATTISSPVVNVLFQQIQNLACSYLQFSFLLQCPPTSTTTSTTTTTTTTTTSTTTTTKAPWPPLPPGLISLNSDIEFYFTINNDLNAIYDMYWIDYNGNYVQYATIQPGEYITQQTFVTHPWVLRSQADGSLIWFKPNVPPFTTSDAPSIPFSKITSTLDDITNFT